MMKKLVLAVLMMFCITASAYAAKNDVHPFTEIPPIVKGVCSQAGSLTLTFENGTIFNPETAEIIGRLSPDVTLCQPIDMYVRLNDTISTVGAPRTTGVVQQEFVATGDAGADIVFRVTGAVGSDEITIVPLNGTLQANNTGMKFVLFGSESSTGELLDPSKVSYNASNGTFYNATGKVDLGDPDLNATALQIPAIQNSLCVKTTADYASHEVRIYLESAPKIYTFSPADSVIAIVGTKPISEVPQKKALTAKIPAAGDQGGISSCLKGYETACLKGYETALGMCESYDGSLNGHFALSSGTGFLPGVYQLEMEVLVNGAGGDHGAYFAALPGGLQLVKKDTDLTGAFVATSPLDDKVTYLGTGAVTTLSPTTSCVPADDEKITKVTGQVTLLPAQTKDMKYLRFNVPSIIVPGLKAGDVVSMKVTLRQGRCRVIYDGARALFTMVDECSTTATPGTLFFPYFAGTDDGYWNGIALVNPGTTDATATLSIVEENGNKADLTVTVPAEGMFVRLVEALSLEPGFTPDAGNVGPMGAARSYITVKGSGLSGFAMMADGAQSMGYVVK